MQHLAEDDAPAGTVLSKTRIGSAALLTRVIVNICYMVLETQAGPFAYAERVQGW